LCDEIRLLQLSGRNNAFRSSNCIFVVAYWLLGILEATRPDPVNLQTFYPGMNKIDVVAKLGNPTGSVKDANQNCDIYRLYTTGPDAIRRGAIAAGEVAADVFTLGLAEVATTPTEVATRNAQHTFLFCYTLDNKLGDIRDTNSRDSSNN
jgi:hypothetical protein